VGCWYWSFGFGFPLCCNLTSIVAIVGVTLFGPTLLQSICLSRCLCRSPMSCIHCISSLWFCRLCRVHQSTVTCSLSGSVVFEIDVCCYRLHSTDYLFRPSHSGSRWIDALWWSPFILWLCCLAINALLLLMPATGHLFRPPTQLQVATP
jgi:hypothetical protein